MKVAEPSPRRSPPAVPARVPELRLQMSGNVCWLQHYITAGKGSGGKAAGEMQQPESQGYVQNKPLLGKGRRSSGKCSGFHKSRHPNACAFKVLPEYKDGEALAQFSRGGCGFPTPGSVQGQAGHEPSLALLPCSNIGHPKNMQGPCQGARPHCPARPQDGTLPKPAHSSS